MCFYFIHIFTIILHFTKWHRIKFKKKDHKQIKKRMDEFYFSSSCFFLDHFWAQRKKNKINKDKILWNPHNNVHNGQLILFFRQLFSFKLQIVGKLWVFIGVTRKLFVPGFNLLCHPEFVDNCPRKNTISFLLPLFQ